MSQISVTAGTITGGIWSGLVQHADATARPDIEVVHPERPIAQATLHPVADAPGTWRLEVPIPVDLLNDGVQTFIIRQRADETQLGSFTVISGTALDADIRAEIGALRAELDLLKQVVRRLGRQDPE